GAELVDVGRQWLGHKALARQIIAEVIQAAGMFKEMAEKHHVAPDSIRRFTVDIEKRLGILRQGL
ncbi:MAG: hypothetical protein D4R84_02505, partial [Rhodocyclaceae bacterium]